MHRVAVVAACVTVTGGQRPCHCSWRPPALSQPLGPHGGAWPWASVLSWAGHPPSKTGGCGCVLSRGPPGAPVPTLPEGPGDSVTAWPQGPGGGGATLAVQAGGVMAGTPARSGLTLSQASAVGGGPGRADYRSRASPAGFRVPGPASPAACLGPVGEAPSRCGGHWALPIRPSITCPRPSSAGLAPTSSGRGGLFLFCYLFGRCPHGRWCRCGVCFLVVSVLF